MQHTMKMAENIIQSNNSNIKIKNIHNKLRC